MERRVARASGERS